MRIPAHCLTSNNRQVRARQLWGSDVYTEDSDLVAVLMHCGYWYHSRECARQGRGRGWGEGGWLWEGGGLGGQECHSLGMGCPRAAAESCASGAM